MAATKHHSEVRNCDTHKVNIMTPRESPITGRKPEASLHHICLLFRHPPKELHFVVQFGVGRYCPLRSKPKEAHTQKCGTIVSSRRGDRKNNTSPSPPLPPEGGKCPCSRNPETGARRAASCLLPAWSRSSANNKKCRAVSAIPIRMMPPFLIDMVSAAMVHTC